MRCGSPGQQAARGSWEEEGLTLTSEASASLTGWRSCAISSCPCTALTPQRSKMNWSRNCWSMGGMRRLCKLLPLCRPRRARWALTRFPIHPVASISPLHPPSFPCSLPAPARRSGGHYWVYQSCQVYSEMMELFYGPHRLTAQGQARLGTALGSILVLP